MHPNPEGQGATPSWAVRGHSGCATGRTDPAPRLNESTGCFVGLCMESAGEGARIGGAEVAVSDLTFDELFAREYKALFRAMFLVTGSPQEAEELMQDAFLKVWERWDRVGRMENPNGYLYRVAMNGARSRLRRLRMAAAHAAALRSADDPFAVADLRDELVRALAGLSERQRMALVLTDLLDLPADEAARVLRVRTPTVRSLASQARTALRGKLEREDV
jgi:RNA polymerase sigma-70 factor, ECF subfamily